MRKWLIETLIIGMMVGAYMFYGQSIMDWLAGQYSIAESSYLYAAGAFVVIIFASLIGKAVTRGMH